MDAVRFALLATVLAVGCGSSDRKETAEPGGRPTTAPGPAGAGPLTEADCDRLLDHWFELVIADKRKTAKPDEVPTEEDVAKARARLEASSKKNCVGSPRAPYDCSMKATSTDEIKVCLEGGRS